MSIIFNEPIDIKKAIRDSSIIREREIMDIKLTKEEFENLYQSMSGEALAKKLGVKINQIYKTARELNIKKHRGTTTNRIVIEG